ncbi:UNVERIFIED_CONTAM: hypothetical protein K2H54_068285 [Gekko kuhli]
MAVCVCVLIYFTESQPPFPFKPAPWVAKIKGPAPSEKTPPPPTLHKKRSPVIWTKVQAVFKVTFFSPSKNKRTIIVFKTHDPLSSSLATPFFSCLHVCAS